MACGMECQTPQVPHCISLSAVYVFSASMSLPPVDPVDRAPQPARQRVEFGAQLVALVGGFLQPGAQPGLARLLHDEAPARLRLDAVEGGLLRAHADTGNPLCSTPS